MVKRFHSPPGWPPLPSPDWVPPPGWTPDPAWPAAPPGWDFYVEDPTTSTRQVWVKSAIGVAAAFWILGWLIVSSMGLFVARSTCRVGASIQCDRTWYAFLAMVAAQVLVLVGALVASVVWRRLSFSMIVASVGVPLVLLAFCVAEQAIDKAS